MTRKTKATSTSATVTQNPTPYHSVARTYAGRNSNASCTFITGYYLYVNYPYINLILKKMWFIHTGLEWTSLKGQMSFENSLRVENCGFYVCLETEIENADVKQLSFCFIPAEDTAQVRASKTSYVSLLP